MKAMVLGAGAGTRLEPVTNFIPKPLVPVVNRPVIDHIINLLHKHSYEKVICNIHYLADKMQSHFENRNDVDITLKYEPELSGDAGGVRACREFLSGETFVVIMGDLLTDADLTMMLNEHKEKRAIASIGVRRVEDVSRFGVVVLNTDGLVVDFQEKPSAREAKSNQVSSGIYILEPEIFDHIPAEGVYGFGRQLFPLLVEQGHRVAGIELPGYWTDIGTLSDYLKANQDAVTAAVNVPISGNKTERGWIASDAVIDETCEFNGKAVVASGCKINAGVRLSGTVVIGEGAIIEDGARLHDCVVFPHTTVQARSQINNSIVAYGKIASCALATTKSN